MNEYRGWHEESNQHNPTLELLLTDENIKCEFCSSGRAIKIFLQCQEDHNPRLLCKDCWTEHMAINSKLREIKK